MVRKMANNTNKTQADDTETIS